MNQTAQRYLHVVWCDDVRQEVGNKFSYMGVYTNMLLPSQLPMVLPKLCAVVHLSTPRTRPLQALHMRLIKGDAPDQPLVQMEAETESLQQMVAATGFSKPADVDPERPGAFATVMPIMIGPLELTTTTDWLQIVVDCGDEVIESHKLKIQAPPMPPAASSTHAPEA